MKRTFYIALTAALILLCAGITRAAMTRIVRGDVIDSYYGDVRTPVYGEKAAPDAFRGVPGEYDAEHARDSLYFIRDRMTPAMRAKATSCAPLFLYVLRTNPRVMDEMVPIVEEILHLIDKPDTFIPDELRADILSVSYSVEESLKRDRIGNPLMMSLIAQIRAIAADSRVTTVNEMLAKYGDRGARE